MAYEIIAKSEVPEAAKYGKWVNIFDPLDFERAVCFSPLESKEARRLGNTLQQIARQGRRDYRLHIRIIPDGEMKKLYVWKEKQEGKCPE